MDYKWPRENLEQYAFDKRWPNAIVKPSEIVMAFLTFEEENHFRNRMHDRFRLERVAEQREREMQQWISWNIRKW